MEKSQLINLNTTNQNKNHAQQQNININISYNLNTHKLPKSILGAKKTTNKNKKINDKPIQPLGNQFFSNLALNAINEGKKLTKKQNLSKKSNQMSLSNKQSKGLYEKQPKISVDKQLKPANQKKNNNRSKKSKQFCLSQGIQKDGDFNNSFYNCKDILKRNIQSPDIFKIQNNRKFKTQASCVQGSSTLKKIKKKSLITKQDKNLITKDQDKNFIFKQSKHIKQNLKLNNWVKQTAVPFFVNKPTTGYSFKKVSGNSKNPKNKKSTTLSKQKQRRIHTQENQISNNFFQNRHNKSCMLYSNKKGNIITEPNFVQTAEHIMSTIVNGKDNKAPRKRAQSAYAFTKNDKQLVSKLLNMSIISSELGSSQLISSERIKSSRNQITRKRFGLKVDELQDFNNHQLNQPLFFNRQNQFKQKNQYQSFIPGNALRQYLNSIDLRVIKNIEDDRATIEPKFPQKNHIQRQNIAFIQNDIQTIDFQNTLKNRKFQQKKKLNDKKDQLNHNKNQILNKKQEKGNSQLQNKQIISFYNKLFQNALQNKRIQQQQEKYIDSANISQKSISQDLNGSSKLKRQKFIIKDFDEQQNSFDNQQKQFNNRIINRKKKSILTQKNIEQNEFQSNFQQSGHSYQNNNKEKSNKIQKNNDSEQSSDNDSIKQIYQNMNSQQNNNNNNNNNKQQIPQKNSLKLSFNNYKQILNQHAQKVQQQKIQQLNNKITTYNDKNKFCFQLKSCDPKQQEQNHQQQQIDDIQFNQNLGDEFINEKDLQKNNQRFHLTNLQFNQSVFSNYKNQTNSLLSFCKQQQVQRWNNINQFLSKKINQNSNNTNENHQIMQELIKQSNWNKRWIQQQAQQEEGQQIDLNQQKQSQSQRYDNNDFKSNHQKIEKSQNNNLNQKPINKSPKNSLIQKRKSRQNKFQALNNEICWQYNAQQLQKQIQKYASANKLQQKQINKKKKKYDINSPNYFSQDGNGSGQQQYDSKKYSDASQLKDQVIQQNQSQIKQQDHQIQIQANQVAIKQQKLNQDGIISIQQNNQNINKTQTKAQKQQDSLQTNVINNQPQNLKIVYQKQQDRVRQKQLIKRLIDSFDQQEQEQISCEDKQLHSEDRWINYQPSNSNNIRKPIQNNYLECQLSSFGFNNLNNLKQNNKKSQTTQKNQENTQSIIPQTFDNSQPKISKTILKDPKVLNDNQEMNELLQLNDVLKMIENQQNDIEAQFVRMNHIKPDISKNSIKNYQNKQQYEEDEQYLIQNQLIQPNKKYSQQNQADQNNQGTHNEFTGYQKNDRIVAIKKKRLTHIVEDIILELIRQFARDISYILKKSTSQQKKNQKEFQQNSSPFRLAEQSNDFQKDLSPFQKADEQFECFSPQNKKQQILKKNQFLGKCFGIDTSFNSIQKYLKQFKQFLLSDQKIKIQMVRNINKDIGPNSLQILSYLRPEYDTSQKYSNNDDGNINQDKMDHFSQCQDQDGLFIVPSEAFSQYQNYIEQKRQQQNKVLEQQKQVILTQKQKRNLNYWHRGIYQSWNQFLDCERPFGINGKPYDWIQQRKKFRQIQSQQIEVKLQKGIQKLLQAISLPTGIIYDKYDIQAMYSDLGHQQKIFLNQQRLSRMLAIQLLESQQLWINYNDQMAQLLVQLSRIIQQTLVFQISAQFKKIMRKRNCLVN